MLAAGLTRTQLLLAAAIPLVVLRIVLRPRAGAHSPVRPMVDDPKEKVHQ